ncbi:uncharacterized protein LOC129749591 [Uranotaenia lowii]|uniref:uncharacterized protein LOC129749591 n=1 Tax=Uranotaenia lowii TaxID=190385 RepID=UPI0024790333|nr:uncharacterized protein LOC129749591 [Uranotaenia lowii]
MKSGQVVWIGVLLFAATANAQLLCYHCEDCGMGTAPVVMPCGMENVPPAAPTPQPPVTPPTLPTEGPTAAPPQPGPEPTPQPTIPPEITPPQPTSQPEPQPSPQPEPTGDPILTPPPLPTTIAPTMAPPPPQGNPGDLVTPPITPMPGFDSRLIIPLDPAPQQPFVCTTVRTNNGMRDIVRRGCARLGQNHDHTCSSLSGGQHQQCSVCMTHLCNV